MKKIMFNDKYGLTSAVLRRVKTMTRRSSDLYEVGEEVAIAMRYEWMASGGYLERMLEAPLRFKKEYTGAGWRNKMYVKAELMPRRVRILRKWQERLQDISVEDCMKEGVVKAHIGYYVPGLKANWVKESHVEAEDGQTWKLFPTPQEAFAALIDKLSGKGTWESNPLVWVYEFKLID